jgi:hypothetical protein
MESGGPDGSGSRSFTRPRPPPLGPKSGGSGQGQQQHALSASTATAGLQSGADPKTLRERLHQQMEKHRRRMILGPRLSVFQLRDTQLEALLQEEQVQHQQYLQQPANNSTVVAAPASGRAATQPPASHPGYSLAANIKLHNTGYSQATGETIHMPTVVPLSAAVNGGTTTTTTSNAFAASNGAVSVRPSPVSTAAARPTAPAPLPLRGHAVPSALEPASAQSVGHGATVITTAPTVAVSAAALQSHWLYHYDA